MGSSVINLPGSGDTGSTIQILAGKEVTRDIREENISLKQYNESAE
jgi:hypothetical protein